MAIAKKYVTFALLKRGNSSVGRALASQAEGRGFEPRLPLIFSFYFGICKFLGISDKKRPKMGLFLSYKPVFGFYKTFKKN